MRKVFPLVIAVAIIMMIVTIGRSIIFHGHIPFESKNNNALVFNQDETTVATAVQGEGVYLWATAGDKPPVRLQESDLAVPLCFQPDGKTLLAAQNGKLVHWLPNGAKMTLGQHSTNRPKRDTVLSAAYSLDGDTLAILNGDRTHALEVVSHYDTMTIMELPNVEMFCWCQQDVIAVGYNSRVELWSVNGKSKLKEYNITGTKEDDKGHTRISGLCYAKEQQDLLVCNNRGDLFLFGTSHDERSEQDVPDRAYTNIGPIAYGSLRTWGTMPLHIGALTGKEVKAWRFYGGKLEPLATTKEPLQNEHEHYSTLSPSAKWTTIHRRSDKVGHVHWLKPVAIVAPKKN